MKANFICENCKNTFIGVVQKRYNSRWCSKGCRNNHLVSTMIGKKFNLLTVIKEVTPKIFKRKRQDEIIKMVECKCDCGNVCNMAAVRIKSGKIKSCGCLRDNTYKINCDQTTHGLYHHPLRSIWGGMKQRCYDEKVEAFKDYGARGIVVCPEWESDFVAFYNWAMTNGWEKGLDIDRKDNDGNYEPSNCRFVTRKINCNNRRSTRFVELNGEIIALSLACDKVGLRLSLVYGRMRKNGFDFNKAIGF